MADRVRSLRVLAGDKEAGVLSKGAQFEFRYDSNARDTDAVSLVMPVTNAEITRNTLHPVFEMNLPEGYLRQRIIERFRKYAKVDEMFFLALQGSASIGRLGFESDDLERADVTGMAMAELVSTEDPDLFERLVERYIDQTTIAGVQPKVLVPENTERKSAFYLPELIVKTSGPEFPGMAINEFVCMSIAQRAGLEVPEFHLSDNRQLFVMRRFDITSNGDRLGMEDICVLMGITADHKYERSYEQVAKAIRIFSGNSNRDLEIFFRSLCVSVLVGNGDAHLKNFAMLYDGPVAGKGWFSPAYDIVNTTVYIEGDPLALKLCKTKDYPNRTVMARFGREHCFLTDKMARNIIDQCLQAVVWGINTFPEFCQEVEFEGRTLGDELEHGLGRLTPPGEKSGKWKGEVRKPRRVR